MGLLGLKNTFNGRANPDGSVLEAKKRALGVFEVSIQRKSLGAITVADLEALVDQEARETLELEFKGTLPFKPEKNQPQTADRWIEKGDRIGDFARDRLLGELVAFANAEGGTLLLGIEETSDDPRRACGLKPLPRCEDLARRLLDATEDVIEPRLPMVEAKALPINREGEGYVLLRVGRSMVGPHRLSSTGEFLIRRGERATKMTVRDIKDLTLELARTGDRLEQAFAQRREDWEARCVDLFEDVYSWEGLERSLIGQHLLIRAAAFPLTPIHIPQLTSRPELWWNGQGFMSTVVIDERRTEYQCDYPAREFNGRRPQVQLRQLTIPRSPVFRTLSDSGLVEVVYAQSWKARGGQGVPAFRSVYVGWVLSVLYGILGQIERLRRKLALGSTEFGLELELVASHPIAVRWSDHGFDDARAEDAASALFPRYSIRGPETFNELASTVVGDLWNLVGEPWTGTIECDWSSILRGTQPD